MGMEINDRTLLHIFRNFLKLGKAVWKTGSYNPQDPTWYEKADVWMVFENGDPINRTQEPAVYKINYNDCTWGISVKVTGEDGKIILDSYLDGQSGEWKRHEHKGNEVEVREFLLACMGDGEMRSKKPDLEDEYNTAAEIAHTERAAGWDPSP